MSSALRVFASRSGVPLVLLYGHKLNGNLRALYDEIRASSDVDVLYLTPDLPYHRHLKNLGESSVLGFSWQGLLAMSRARLVVTDHGPQLLGWLQFASNLLFVDVWHGIPFKGWDSSDFRSLHRYDEIWVPSELLRQIYVGELGFQNSQLRVTGYGRTDALIARSAEVDTFKADIGIGDKRVLLFAPTWTHGAERSEIPFGLDPSSFYSLLEEAVEDQDAVCIVRAHLNTSLDIEQHGKLMFLPHETFPDTESLLQAVDVLVCDWSSIAFDFLLLDRPTIFLDVPAPFPKGFTLDGSYRFGAIADGAEPLKQLISSYLQNPGKYHVEYGRRAIEVKMAVYGDMADGQATRRYLEAMQTLLGA